MARRQRDEAVHHLDLRLRAAPAGLLAAVALALTGACGSGPGDSGSAGGGRDRVAGSTSSDVSDHDVSDAEDRVAHDAGATPREIFAVGSPQQLSARPDGSLVTAYAALSDSEGEGPVQVAWRVLDADGHRVAQGRVGQTGTVLAVDDGFLVLDGAPDAGARVRHVATGGGTATVRAGGRAAYPGRGDTLLPDYPAYYRVSTRTLLTSPTSAPVRQVGVAGDQNAALSQTGGLYLLADPPGRPLRVAVTADGGRSWRTSSVATGASEPSLVAAEGGTAAIALGRSLDGAGFTGLALTRDGGRTWRRTGNGSGLPSDVYVDQLDVGPDQEVVVGGFGTGWWRSRSPGGTTYAPLPVPPGGVSRVVLANDRLLAISATGLWTSTDTGRTWTRIRP